MHRCLLSHFNLESSLLASQNLSLRSSLSISQKAHFPLTIVVVLPCCRICSPFLLSPLEKKRFSSKTKTLFVFVALCLQRERSILRLRRRRVIQSKTCSYSLFFIFFFDKGHFRLFWHFRGKVESKSPSLEVKSTIFWLFWLRRRQKPEELFPTLTKSVKALNKDCRRPDIIRMTWLRWIPPKRETTLNFFFFFFQFFFFTISFIT